MKNFKLLLASTAILSTGLAVVAMAEGEYDGDPTGSVTLKAYAKFTSPIRVNSIPIYFGLLDPAIGGQVTVYPTFTPPYYTGSAVLSEGSDTPLAGSVTLYGGVISEAIDSSFVKDGDTGFVAFDNLANKNITLIERGSVTQEKPNGTTCGTVTTFTEGVYGISEVQYDENYIYAISIPIGATLTITPGYQPSGYSSICEGSTTITYLLNPDF